MWTTPVDRRANVAMSSLVARSRDASRETRKLIERSRELIAVSRRLLNPAWRVSGASDAELSPAAAADPVALRLVIRRRLREDTLFPAPCRIWLGAGQGRFCVVCAQEISAREIGNEMILGPVTMWAHLPCYTIWREESSRGQEKTLRRPQEA